MPPFPKPRFQFDYSAADEIPGLRKYFTDDPTRAIPQKRADRVLVATWNIANCGVQQRTSDDYQLIAEIISWFDVVAVQEIHTNLVGLRAILEHLPKSYRALYSDGGGNDERLTFVFDSAKVSVSDEIGEVAPSPNDFDSIRLPGIAARSAVLTAPRTSRPSRWERSRSLWRQLTCSSAATRTRPTSTAAA